MSPKLNRRQFIGVGLATGFTLSFPAPALIGQNPNGKIRLASISCGSRANQLMNIFREQPEIDIVGLCDPDAKRMDATKQKFEVEKTFSDPRDLLEDKNIDAVIVATCNHWHCLGAVWAMQAGKDVYVEKPLAHNPWEGVQTVKAARKYKRVCQVGTQQRSDPMQAEIKDFLFQEKALGNILTARVNHYSIRQPVGKRDTPLEIPAEVNYDLWLGPAQDQPLYRNQLHYDWHWDWNTGCGEMGNWGVHVLDDCRNNVLQDALPFPKRILAGGGRVGYNDAAQTPNIHFVYFDTGSIPVVLGLSNLQDGPDSKSAGKHPGPGSGYIAYCEGGRLEGQRGRAVAYDKDGKEIKQFKGTCGEPNHVQNFIKAVLAQDSSLLNAEVKTGHESSGWCNLANIAVRAGKAYAETQVPEANDIWEDVVTNLQQVLAHNNLSLDNKDITMSSLLSLDPQTGIFVGEGAETANAFQKREFRAGYEVPEIQD